MIELNDRETLIWLAGLLEGEGSFMKGPPSKPNAPIISISSTDKDVIQKVSDIWGRKYTTVRRHLEKWKASYLVRISGKRAIRWMEALSPFMSERRKFQIHTAIASHTLLLPGRRLLSDSDVRQIRLLAQTGEFTMRELGEQFGVDHSSISRIVSGKTYCLVDENIIN